MRRGVFLIVVALASSFGVSCAGKGQVACDDPVTATSIEMTDDGYSPACLQASTGTEVTLQNLGDAPHTYTVTETPLEAKADPGGTTSLTVTDIAPGTYEVICTLHPDMRAALKVV